MRRCSKCGAEAVDLDDTCGICGAALDVVGLAGVLPEGPVMATLVEPPFHPKPPQSPVGVPRRFSVGTMMILVTAFAVLFAVLKTFDVHPAVFAGISIFIAGIATCQSLLFKGKKPRLASFVGGIIMLGLANVVVLVVSCVVARGLYWQLVIFVPLCAVQSAVIGGPLGYAVGCIIAAIFLVRKEPVDAELTTDEFAEHGP